MAPIRARPRIAAARLEKALDGYVAEALEAWNVPGLAVGVVGPDGVVLSKGYGVRQMGGSASVGPDTVFCIGSLSKAFTAALLGILVDEGRVRWDDPVQRHLPDFRLADPALSRLVTIRDLLAHRVG